MISIRALLEFGTTLSVVTNKTSIRCRFAMVDEFGNDELGVNIFIPSLTSEKRGRFKLVNQ